jgi:hypothetical protein
MKFLNNCKKIVLVALTLFVTPTFLVAQTTNEIGDDGPAFLQVIHNAADPAAAVVDIYVNGVNAIPNFEFRDATAFIELQSNTNLEIVVAPGGSSSAADGIATFNVTLEPNKSYIAVANGVLSPADFAANPDMVSTGFDLIILPDVNQDNSNSDNTYVRVVHGATDAPGVDIAARGVGTLVPGAEYTDFATLNVGAAEYVLDVKVAGTETIAAAFDADLSGAGGAAITVLASGFLNVSANQYGAQFGLLAVFADGTTAMLPAKTGKAQVIHNAADPGAAFVDVYLNGALLLEDFAFRAATPFVELPAYLTHFVTIAGPGSESVEDGLATFEVAPAEGESYQLIATGVLTPADFATNPNDISTAFTLLVADGAAETSENGTDVGVRVVHGATDAPAVDVRVSGGGAVLVPAAEYLDFTGYLQLAPSAYKLDITVASDGSAIVATYDIDVSALGGAAATVVASGFLTPASNNDGEAFGLNIVLPDGTTFLAPLSTSIGDSDINTPTAFELRGNYPNPFNPTTVIRYSVPTTADVSLTVYDMLGRQVAVLVNGTQAAGSYDVNFDATNLSSGMYLYRLQSGSFVQTQKMMLVK